MSPILALTASLLPPCALLLLGPSPGSATAQGSLILRWVPAEDMVRVPTLTLELGSSYAELIDTAEWCNRMSQSRECRVEDFATELSLGTKQTVASFWIDRTETTISAYERCVRAGSCSPSDMEKVAPGITAQTALPITMVSQRDAADYCAFRDARLPSEEEFEVAARGAGHRRFPWGNLFHAARVNGGDLPPASTTGDDGYERLAPAGAFSDGQTPLGVLQLAGNAAEWTSSRMRDADGKPGPQYVVRGGDFASPPWRLRAAHREALLPQTRRLTVGFRCARSGG